MRLWPLQTFCIRLRLSVKCQIANGNQLLRVLLMSVVGSHKFPRGPQEFKLWNQMWWFIWWWNSTLQVITNHAANWAHTTILRSRSQAWCNMYAWNHLWNHNLISWVHKTSLLFQTYDGLLISGFGHPSRLNRYPMTNANLWHLRSSWVPRARIDQADSFIVDFDDWSVGPHIFRQLDLKWGCHPIDRA